MSDNGKGVVHSPEQLGRLLQDLWEQQDRYNQTVKSVQTEIVNWGETYILGVMTELKEILDEMKWKRHQRRSRAPVNRDNMADELADITKYVLSLWLEFGFSLEEVLQRTVAKGNLLQYRLAREFFPPMNQKVILTDLDGTVADFRAGFSAWMKVQDSVHSLSMDLDNNIPFGLYEELKNQFEREGGYGALPEYPDAVALLKNEKSKGAFLFVSTARPSEQFKRVPNDTMGWLEQRGIVPDSILFGRDERVIALLGLRGTNQVVLLEDDATLAMRAANSGIFVYLRDQPYNRNISAPLIERCTKFPDCIDWERILKETDAWKEERSLLESSQTQVGSPGVQK